MYKNRLQCLPESRTGLRCGAKGVAGILTCRPQGKVNGYMIQAFTVGGVIQYLFGSTLCFENPPLKLNFGVNFTSTSQACCFPCFAA